LVFIGITINIIRSLCLLILSAYVIVKPYDSDTAENEASLGPRGASVRDMLERLEYTSLVQKICPQKNYTPLAVPLLKKNSSHDDAARVYQEYLSKHKIKIFSKNLPLEVIISSRRSFKVAQRLIIIRMQC
jgi:hypothetical protein